MSTWNETANEIFLEAILIEDSDARGQYVSSKCAGNKNLVLEVEQMISAYEASQDFLNSVQQETWGFANASSVRMDAKDLGLPKPICAGTMIGRFQVQRMLGSGGMGIVYLATDTRLNRQVAIKIPRPNVVRELELRFEREAKTMAAINHPNLAKIFDVDRWNDQTILIMDFVPGECLSEMLRRNTRIDDQRVTQIMQKLASATACAHASGVIHRDIKPGNIIMRSDEEPVLMDFGLAYLENDDARMTKAGAIMGTPSYMAPEQLTGATHKIGPRSDVYALGAICYELITGRAIYEGSASSVLAALSEGKPVTPPSEIVPTVDPQLEAICLKAIARDPQDRFASAEQLSDAFRFLLANDQAQLKPLLQTASKNQRVGRRWTWVAAAAGALFLFFAIFIIQTSEGEFVLDTEDPEIAARLAESGGIVVENRLTKSSYTLHRGANKLPNGNYELTVTSPDGLEVSTPKFQIRRLGGRVIATVTARPRNENKNSLESPPKKLTASDIVPGLLASLPADLAEHPLLSPNFKWSEPENLGRSIFPEGQMNECFVSDDELALVFRNDKSTRIATRENRTLPFSTPVIAIEDRYVFFSSFTKDKLGLVCCGMRDSGRGGFDLMQWSRPTTSDDWQYGDWFFDYLNSEDNDGQPCLSSDGLELYFCSTRPDTIGLDDLFVAKRSNVEEKFGAPIRLNDGMNSRSQDFSPCLTAGDRILLFNSDRGGGFGMMDIYMSIRTSRDEMFTIPILLDVELNSPNSESRPTLSSDGTTLYFDSNRPGGNRHSDLWCIRRIPK